MKKYLLSGLLLTFILYVHAQNNKDLLAANLQGNNEIKLNILYSAFASPEITYERIITLRSAIGLSFLYNFNHEINIQHGFTPYYRFYLGKRKASGFFFEGNAMFLHYLNSYVNKMGVDFSGQPYAARPKNTFGLGAAIGTKFLTKSGFTGEIYFGLGKEFTKQRSWLDLQMYPRAGLTLGKRF